MDLTASFLRSCQTHYRLQKRVQHQTVTLATLREWLNLTELKKRKEHKRTVHPSVHPSMEPTRATIGQQQTRTLTFMPSNKLNVPICLTWFSLECTAPSRHPAQKVCQYRCQFPQPRIQLCSFCLQIPSIYPSSVYFSTQHCGDGGSGNICWSTYLCWSYTGGKSSAWCQYNGSLW